MNHPRHALDEIIHAPVRLSIMALLAAAETADFRFLRDTVEVSDSLLSKHLDTLEKAGYVRVEKGFVGKRPRTWLALTEEGRAAFQEYTAVLRRITEGGQHP
ncbi:winged helix-turn-helix domain-containing protein [Nonomuraea sp. NPDC050540]|uniref:winged helix-turn-helix domain-containing protein n=1 Tax=Nonomuraea sp. NPDC050540 TaxID=3364367 RepID=UPI003795B357